MATGPIKARPQFTDVTSEFTTDSTKLNAFKAMTDGKTVYVYGRVKKGVTDQSQIAVIPARLRPTTIYLVFPTFCLHGEDLTKGAVVATPSESTIQFRISTPGTGQYGIAFFGSYPIGF